MKKIVFLFLAAMTLIMVNSVAGYAHGGGHFRAGISIGPGWWPAYPYYAQPYYYAPPQVVVREAPQEYVQQEPPQVPEETNYSYYCPDAKGYYPDVKKCPEGWLKVVPSPAPPDTEEE